MKNTRVIVFLFGVFVLALTFSFAMADPPVYLLLESLDGLKEGDPVVYNELTIGHVDDIRFFDESFDQQSYFVAKLVIKKDMFKYLYREMPIKVKPIALFSPRRQILIEENDTIKLNRLHRNEYLFAHSENSDFIGQAIKILDKIFYDTKPMRDTISNQIMNGFQKFINSVSVNEPDSSTAISER